MAQPDRGERLAEAAALRVGPDADDVHLAELLLGVHLRPVEADQLAVALGEEEALRVEPRLGLAVVQVALGERALLGVVGEGGGVHREPGRVVLAGHEGADGDARPGAPAPGMSRSAQRAPHLAQFAEEGEAEDLGEVPGRGLARRAPRPAAACRTRRAARRPAPARARARGAPGARPARRPGPRPGRCPPAARTRRARAPSGEQEVPYALPAPAAQLQPALLGDRLLPSARAASASSSRTASAWSGESAVERLDRTRAGRRCGVIAGHAYEGTAGRVRDEGPGGSRDSASA